MCLSHNKLLVVMTCMFLSFSFYYTRGEKKKIVIEQAAVLKRDLNLVENAKLLIGDVVLKSDNVIMYCDSAIFYELENIVDAYHNVHIISNDTNHLYSGYVHYTGDISHALAKFNVRLENPSMKLFTDQLDYYVDSGIAYYDDYGRVVDSSHTLTSIIGEYHVDDNLVYFQDSVVAYTKNQDTLKSDTLIYHTNTEVIYIEGPTEILSLDRYLYSEKGYFDSKQKQAQSTKASFLSTTNYWLKSDSVYINDSLKIGIAQRNAWMYDSSRNVMASGHYIYVNDSTNEAVITDSGMIYYISTSDTTGGEPLKTDTLYLHADTLHLTQVNDSSKVLYGKHNVKFYREDLQGSADHLSYFERDTLGIFKGNAVLWMGYSQLTAKEIKFFAKQQKIDSLVCLGNPILSNEDSLVPNFYNQITGNILKGSFTDGEPHTFLFEKNGQSIYFPINTDDNLILGIDEQKSENIRINVRNREVISIVFLNKPTGILRPLPQTLDYLPGFKWRENERPLYWKDVFSQYNYKYHANEGTEKNFEESTKKKLKQDIEKIPENINKNYR